MRPAYRLSLLVLLLFSLGLIGLIALSLGPDRATRRGSERLEPIVLTPDAALVGGPEEAKVQGALEQLEAAEVERFGATEAARRRRLREQLVRERTAPDAAER